MSTTPDLSDLGRRIQPILWTTIELWHREEAQVTTWEDAAALLPADDAPEMRLDRCVESLQLINTFQWHEEDRSREHGAGDEVLAAVKRSIDASNARRVRRVDELDDLIWSLLGGADEINAEAPLHSESPGSIIDRMTVLALKIYHLKEAIAEARKDDATDAETMARLAARHRTLADQLVDLCGCLDLLLAEVQIGRRRLKLYRQVKIYRDPATGRFDTDLS